MPTTTTSSVEHLALQLAHEPAVEELRAARGALNDDERARTSLEQLQQRRVELLSKQSSGAPLGDEELAAFETLQAAVLNEPVVQRLIEAERAVTDLLGVVADAIDEASGLPFTRLASRGGC